MTRSSTPCVPRRTFAVNSNIYTMSSTLKNILKGSIFGYSWKSRLIVISTSLIFAVGSVALGLYLDSMNISEKKIFTPLLLVLSFPLAQLVMHRFIMPKK